MCLSSFLEDTKYQMFQSNPVVRRIFQGDCFMCKLPILHRYLHMRASSIEGVEDASVDLIQIAMIRKPGQIKRIKE